MQKSMQKWLAWFKELGEKAHIKYPGHPLERTGKVVAGKQKSVHDGHRVGFQRYRCWKSRNVGGRPQIDAGLRAPIRRMSIENWLWVCSSIGALLPITLWVAPRCSPYAKSRIFVAHSRYS
jgi:hypothetical protein